MKTFLRPVSTSPELEACELAWWQRFADLENRFAWVQTAEMQTILRGRYVEEIVRATTPGGRILELGCGAGWLCLALARFGAREVRGVDFSSTQINLANEAAKAAGLADRVHFECADGTAASSKVEQFDCVVIHAFLHHLDQNEIRRTILSIPRLLKPDGVCIIFEPVIRPSLSGGGMTGLWDRQRGLQRAAESGRQGMSPEEEYWRGLLAERSVGTYPHGPSPKEMPFAEGELESYLALRFKLDSKQSFLVGAHLVVEDWLLRALSDPEFVRPRLTKIARIASRLDQLMSERGEFPVGAWVFTMFVCRLAPRSPVLDEIERFRARKSAMERRSRMSQVGNLCGVK